MKTSFPINVNFAYGTADCWSMDSVIEATSFEDSERKYIGGSGESVFTAPQTDYGKRCGYCGRKSTNWHAETCAGCGAPL